MSSSTKTGRIDVVATGACLSAVGLWSTGPILIKYLTGPIDSWSQNALRYSVACLFWLPFLLYVVHRGALDPRTWRRAVPPSVANIVMQSLYAAAFYHIDPGFLTLLSNTSALWVAGFSLVLFREERLLIASPRFWGGLLLSLGGLFGILYFKEGFAERRTQLGILLALSQAFMWGVYTVSVKTALRDIDSRAGFSVISIYTVVGLWICTLIWGDPGAALRMGVGPWAAVVFSGITAIALAHVFYYTAIRRIGATIPMLVVLAQPLLVFGLSRVIFHERLNGLQLLCGIVLLMGSGLSIWAQQHLRLRHVGPASELSRTKERNSLDPAHDG
ncbi:MAG: DMT family transporter [Sedimentisphaerales bacterium]|nr:DMT family transporter [Sedimentisphaerales bacterium]